MSSGKTCVSRPARLLVQLAFFYLLADRAGHVRVATWLGYAPVADRSANLYKISCRAESSSDPTNLEHLVKYTAEDAKRRAPAWARAPGRSLEAQRAKWRNPNARPGHEYAWAGTKALPETPNLSALLNLELIEATDLQGAISRVLPALTDELFLILVHSIHEMKQTFIKGRPESGRAFQVEADVERVSQYEDVLNAWNAQRPTPPSPEVVRVANFIRDVASDVARPLAKTYGEKPVEEAVASDALQISDLPLLRELSETTLNDISAPPCSKYQSLRIALKRILKIVPVAA